ncbi:MAG: flavohemoglobin expression-modulating QEGLA motif protein, partial [Polyangiaceae bacterium]|nr:flavohemoglobin expression-modulating QEGLA motif protein [Polyangiaceae bacterium]
PLNFHQEVERLFRSWLGGQKTLPAFSYHLSHRELGAVVGMWRRRLQGVQVEVVAWKGAREVQEIFQGKLDELFLELEILEARGSALVLALSQSRFPIEEALLNRAMALAESWCTAGVGSEESEDRGVSLGLEEFFRRKLHEEGIEIDVRASAISSRAAVTNHCLLVQKNVVVSPTEAERLFHHEVKAHLLPRLNAKGERAPAAIGSRESDFAEEGRAILCEERANLLGLERRQELAWRTMVTHELLGGERPHQIFAKLRQDSDSEVAQKRLVATIVRALRGGGLCRERIYLPAFLAVKDLFQETPGAEAWLKRGRWSLFWAKAFAKSGVQFS